MSFQQILYIYIGVLIVAYASGWVVHIMGRNTRHLSGLSYHARNAQEIEPHTRLVPWEPLSAFSRLPLISACVHLISGDEHIAAGQVTFTDAVPRHVRAAGIDL